MKKLERNLLEQVPLRPLPPPPAEREGTWTYIIIHTIKTNVFQNIFLYFWYFVFFLAFWYFVIFLAFLYFVIFLGIFQFLLNL